MLRIGEIAHITGVSRRMLRHWEEIGLITPASVDRFTGYRRYARSQVGRVRAVASLRALGFALGAIGDLLDVELTEERLVELLRERERALTAQIDEASARLTEVRIRLTALEKGYRTIMNTLEFGPLPSLRLAALQATVRDESEIPDAVAELLPRLRDLMRDRGIGSADIVLVYDGTDDDSIVVTTGILAGDQADPRLDTVEVPSADHGVSVAFDGPPSDVGDAWIALDANLEAQDQATTGLHRQTLTAEGGVILQASVRRLH
jgi:DNA-binding transcriptional MerR regulator